METLKLEFNPNIKSKIIDLLSVFSADDLKISTIKQIEYEELNFAENKKILDIELEKVRSGTAILYTLDEVDAYLDKTISKYES